MNARFLTIMLLGFALNSCGPLKVDPNLVGHWQAEKTALTVRIEPSRMKFEF